MTNRAPAACAEFPNDNPALHRGAIWRCSELAGTLVCETPAPRPHGFDPWTAADGALDETSDSDPLHIEVVDELTFDEVVDEAEVAGFPNDPRMCREDFGMRQEAPSDPFVVLVRVLEDAIRAQGANDAAVGCLRALFGLARMDGVVPAEGVVAWQGILRGESDDFAACGPKPLDEWAAEVVARTAGMPARKEGIRRDLRARGVAAFGLVTEAA